MQVTPGGRDIPERDIDVGEVERGERWERRGRARGARIGPSGIVIVFSKEVGDRNGTGFTLLLLLLLLVLLLLLLPGEGARGGKDPFGTNATEPIEGRERRRRDWMYERRTKLKGERERATLL